MALEKTLLLLLITRLSEFCAKKKLKIHNLQILYSIFVISVQILHTF